MTAPGRGPAATSPKRSGAVVARDPDAWGSKALFFVLMLGSLAATSSAVAQIDTPAELKVIEGVRFEGRHHVPRKDLDAVLKTRNPSRWPWRRQALLRLDFVRADTSALERVCWQRGYLDAVVNARLDPGKHREGITVTYILHEGPRYYVGGVKLTGLGPVPEPPLRRHLYARPGRPYNPFYLYADTARIADACRQRGFLPRVYALAERRGRQQVAPAPADTTVYEIEYFIELGRQYRFGEVNLSSPGRTRVKPRLVLREIVFKPGETYKASEVQESIEQIYGTGLFNLVQMTPLPDSSNGVVEFDLRVRERRPRWLDAGVGSGTAERFRFTGEWGHRNLNARGLQAVASSKLALDGKARFLLARGEATLYDPWLLRQRRRGSATVFIEAVHDRANPDYIVKQESRGVSFQIRRDYRRFSRLVVTQANSFVQQRFELTSTVPDTTVDRLRLQIPPSYSTHRLQLAVERDTRDDLISPFRGTYTNFTGEIAGGPLQGSSSFTRVSGTTSWYVVVQGASVLAFRVRAGSIDPFGKAKIFTPDTIDSRVQRVPLEDRFRLGGVNSLRGYDENALPGSGGLAMLLANAELRVPLVGPFGAEFFVDAGNVWARPSFMRVHDFALRISDAYYDVNAIRYVGGMGLRLNLPFGPLRFDVSWSSQRDRGSRNPLLPASAGQQDLRDRRPVPQIAIGTTF